MLTSLPAPWFSHTLFFVPAFPQLSQGAKCYFGKPKEHKVGSGGLHEFEMGLMFVWSPLASLHVDPLRVCCSFLLYVNVQSGSCPPPLFPISCFASFTPGCFFVVISRLLLFEFLHFSCSQSFSNKLLPIPCQMIILLVEHSSAHLSFPAPQLVLYDQIHCCRAFRAYTTSHVRNLGGEGDVRQGRQGVRPASYLY